MSTDPTIEWLLKGDPAICWQTKRDLLRLPEDDWRGDRARLVDVGWGKRLLELQDANGTWGGGIYSPKWTSTTYTLLTLIDMGIDPQNDQAKRGATQILESILSQEKIRTLPRLDQCVYGFYFQILSYFEVDHPALALIRDHLLAQQMEDGGWNCRRERVKTTTHSSFHTTLNVLEGLRAGSRGGYLDCDRFLQAETAAIEFLLCHRLYKSDRTGDVINEHFIQFSYPPRWHYDILRALDYIRQTTFRHDPRLYDALQIVRGRARDSIWPAQNKHPGREFFSLEKPANRSRWNTLRAMRVLQDIEPGKQLSAR